MPFLASAGPPCTVTLLRPALARRPRLAPAALTVAASYFSRMTVMLRASGGLWGLGVVFGGEGLGASAIVGFGLVLPKPW